MVRRFSSEGEYNRAFFEWIQRGLLANVRSFLQFSKKGPIIFEVFFLNNFNSANARNTAAIYYLTTKSFQKIKLDKLQINV